MLSAPNLIPTLHKNRTPRQRAKLAEDPGRKAGTLAGGYVSDLVSLGKAVTLGLQCCLRKASPKRGRDGGLEMTLSGVLYVTHKNIPRCIARCDGCKQTGLSRLLLPATTNLLTGAR